MPRNDQVTLTLYPIWAYWLGRLILYVALIIAPIVVIEWLISALPLSFQSIGKIIADVFVLPIIYACLYLILRMVNARSQAFIYVMIFTFGSMAYTNAERAWTIGGVAYWLSAVLFLAYAAGFIWLVLRGHTADKQKIAAAYNAEREAQINMHAEAILRAKELERLHATAETPRSA